METLLDEEISKLKDKINYLNHLRKDTSNMSYLSEIMVDKIKSSQGDQVSSRTRILCMNDQFVVEKDPQSDVYLSVHPIEDIELLIRYNVGEGEGRESKERGIVER